MPNTENFQKITRKSERVSVIKDAKLLTESGLIKIRVSNVSNTGEKVTTKVEIHHETDVLFQMAGLSAAGHIVWVKGSQAGVKFYRPFNRPLF